MRRFLNTSSLILLAVLASAPSFGQIKAALTQPGKLIHQEIGDALADDYAGVPYGKGHVLFLSNRGGSATTSRDPQTNEPFARPFLLRIRDLKTLPYTLPEFLANQPSYIGQCALLPDSSALIASHSRKKPYKDGRVGMTLTYIPFNGDEARALPFVAPDADYQHPYFDALDYTLYFASNVKGGKGGYDLYKSTLSFDGVWSTPQSVDIANTKDNEVFPTTSTDLDLYFSRSSRNYGLQLYALGDGDTLAQAVALNNRGDDFGLLFLNDSTLLVSKSKRSGSAANLHIYSLPTKVLELGLNKCNVPLPDSSLPLPIGCIRT